MQKWKPEGCAQSKRPFEGNSVSHKSICLQRLLWAQGARSFAIQSMAMSTKGKALTAFLQNRKGIETLGNSNYFATIQCYCATNKEVVDCFCHNATNCVSDNQNNQQNSNDRQIYYFCFARSSYYKQKRGLSTKTLLVCLSQKWCGLVAVLVENLRGILCKDCRKTTCVLCAKRRQNQREFLAIWWQKML